MSASTGVLWSAALAAWIVTAAGAARGQESAPFRIPPDGQEEQLVGGLGYEAPSALAFDARVNGQTLTFDADPSGVWTDQETGSTWTLDGAAIAGPLVGERLDPRADAYTLFWFAWRHFQPDGDTYPN